MNSRILQLIPNKSIKIVYGTFTDYSPRGISRTSQTSRNWKGNVKAGRDKIIKKNLGHYLFDEKFKVLSDILNPSSIVVPVPRSSPIKSDSLWPSMVICQVLIDLGLAGSVMPCIERIEIIRKSSEYYSGTDRPSVLEHLETLSIIPEIIEEGRQIVVVDDVITMGRTSTACYLLLKEAFPDVEIKIFSMISTKGFEGEIEAIYNPRVSDIICYSSGNIFRN